jgi:hypothetical protein
VTTNPLPALRVIHGLARAMPPSPVALLSPFRASQERCEHRCDEEESDPSRDAQEMGKRASRHVYRLHVS